MKQMVVDGDTPYLPEEIITNILKRLPVKSLTRFQCVCKCWKNLLKTPSFIADHLHHSSSQNLLLFQRNSRYYPLNLFLLDCEMQVREVQNAHSIGSLLRVKIIGSSNGLLLVQIDNDKYGSSPTSLLLWNPAIREVRHVPRTIDGFEGDCYIGFGFSPILNDYKILRIYTEFSGVVNRVEVYSLNTGSWKELEFGKLEGVYLSVETVTINGAMFWDGLLELGVEEGDEDDIDVIVSFDMALEVFSLIPRPPFHSNTGVKFTAYENKLAILVDSGIENFTYSLLICG